MGAVYCSAKDPAGFDPHPVELRPIKKAQIEITDIFLYFIITLVNICQNKSLILERLRILMFRPDPCPTKIGRKRGKERKETAR